MTSGRTDGIRIEPQAGLKTGKGLPFTSEKVTRNAMPISISEGSGATPVRRVGIRGPSANSTMAATYGMSLTKPGPGAWWTMANA